MIVYCQECDETLIEFNRGDRFEHAMKRPTCVPCLSAGQEPQPPPPPLPPLAGKIRGTIEFDHGDLGYRWWCDCGEHSQLFHFRAGMYVSARKHQHQHY